MSISFAAAFIYVVLILPNEELVERWQIEVSLKNKSPDQSFFFFFSFQCHKYDEESSF